MRILLKALTILLLLLPSLTAGQAAFGYGGQPTDLGDAIERYRKGDVFVRVLDDAGRPITGASVTYKQVTRDFLFGVSGGGASEESTWLLLKEAGVNYVEVFLSWNATESPGGRRYTDQFLKPSFLKKSGFLLSGHCLVWMVASYPEVPGADPWNLPTRVKSLTYDELKDELYNHVYGTVAEYKSLIKYWGINEPFWPYADPFYLNERKWIEIVSLSVQAIRKADPQAKIYVNNILGDLPEWNYYPIKHMKLLMDRGIEFDAIGVELYGQPRASLVPVDSKGYPALSSVSMRLDQYGKLGKPIILTEVDVTAIPGEKAQAEWLKDLYTMAFGKSYVKGIAWSFGTFDDPWLPKGGLFDCQERDNGICVETGRPRQAYYALKNLTRSWWTEGSGVTDSGGNLRFRGFAGNYSMTVTVEGFKQLDTVIHVQEQVENPFEIHMHMRTVSATTTTTEGRRSIALTSTLAPSTVTPSYAFALSQQEIFVAVIGILVLCLVIEIAVTRKRRKRQ